MNKIEKQDFIEAIENFKKMEESGSFYDRSINLINKGCKTEAYILILATWNIGHFKFAVRDFSVNDFDKQIRKLQPYIDKMKDGEIKTIDFDNYKDDIEKIYTTLAQISGIKYTGASKVMHLINPNVFVMWDNYIRGQKWEKCFQKLDIVKKGYRCWKQYGNDGESYFQFLKDMQGLFKHLNYQDNTRTFAKLIDEYNYVNITRPIQEMEQQEQREKSAKEK